ncbi:hypothetical protein DDB_G0290459 [Dictyostelium discoideum AX4]|uniref:J domain-containing protein n=1 Tax=Dictyostelium discoideum TaxID=44689 RepID=Q54G34_DICDI|nr:hypothetical protein DDB_G0290459 [Dictyostelium discoideum AX4]EAL62245.1 hypothetical protein DDB_G0290459 [Dictyostelium discoideum AX4]|eukprot:XP_635738.1 hypothetical protein DDB_G0290459 [Dictyostelium discoideum AX4]
MKKVTNEEIKTIESAVNTIGGGELYSFFKISNYSNEAEITKAYNEFKKINNNDTTAMDSCYKVLSDSRLRSIYDSIYFKDLIKQNNNIQQQSKQQHQQHQSGNQIDENNKLLLLKTLSIPLYTLSTILNANSGIINNNNNQINLLNGGIINYLIKSHKELIQLIFEKSGIIGFYRGSIFKVISYPFQKLFVNIPSSILLNQCFYKNSFIKPLIYKTISEFPSTLLSDYMILSFSTPLINQIKNLFGNNSSGGVVVIDSISIKNLFYSIGSSIILLSTRRLILNLIKKVEIKIIQSKIENPNSKLIKYSQIIYCNPVIQCLLTTLLINPLEVLRLQSMVSYLNNSSNNLKILSPIQMVIDLIKNQNSNLFGYLFNGAPTLYLYLLILNLKKLNNNNNNDNIHSLI